MSDGDSGDRLLVDGDELAGVVDMFGGLTRAELDRALSELAFKHGADPPADEVIDAALAAYALVAYDPDGTDDGGETSEPDETGDPGDGTLLVPGPAAFPTLPEGAADLPHILDVEERTVDRAALARAAEQQFRGEAARAVNAADRERIERLLDVSYDLEAWGPVDLGGMRERLDEALDEHGEQ